MPRIRRNGIAQKFVELFWKIGLYIRLSKEDAKKDDKEDDSESVINQEKILRDFVEEYFEPGTYEIVEVFIDDGLTGTDTSRPDFQRLEGCIIRKEVNCMIIKSLARGFRNLADQQKFLEEFIPIHNARFINIGNPFIDTYAKPRSASGLEVPIYGMFNEQFAAVTSEEIRKTFKMKRERGEFIGAFAPYGYRKDPEDKNSLLIDEEAAETVRSIFNWFVNEGSSKREIARRLNQMGIQNPAAYKKKNGFKYNSPNTANNDGLWSANTVYRILLNAMYIGVMVQGRNRIIS
jgi:DNA invertase Pin-like site-specific DNA recombinase